MNAEFLNLIADFVSSINEIKDNDKRRFVFNVLEVAPEAFWYKRASRNHHLEDERGDYGNLRHTVRVLHGVIALCEAVQETDSIRDNILVAASLHDVGRYDVDGKAESTVPEHPHLVRKLYEEHCLSCPDHEEILMIIENHMGIFGEPKFLPKMSPSTMLHTVDYLLAKLPEIL